MVIDDIINAVEITRMYVKDEPNQTLYLIYSNRTNFSKIVDIYNKNDLKNFVEMYLDLNADDFKTTESLINVIEENNFNVITIENEL